MFFQHQLHQAAPEEHPSQTDTDNPQAESVENTNLPINAQSSQKQSDTCDEIFQAKAKLGKYMKEESYSKHYHLLPFKYFVTQSLIPRLLSKVS